MSPTQPPPATIRLAELSDAAALAALASATFPLACPPGIDPADMAVHVSAHLSSDFFAKTISAPDAAIYLAEAGTSLVGYVLVYTAVPDGAQVPASIGPETTAELSKCYVVPNWQGAGLAGKLVEAAVATAQQAGAGGIWLGVNCHNRRAQRFYTKMGFGVVGQRHFRVGQGIHLDSVMERRLG